MEVTALRKDTGIPAFDALAMNIDLKRAWAI
jgi:hypothetical protein